MRLCFIVDYYLPHIGGGEVYVSGLAEELVRRGHACVVVTARFDRRLPVREVINGVTVVRISLPRPSRLCFFVLGLPRMMEEARKSDVVIGASYGGAVPAFLTGFFSGRPCCLIVYEFMAGLWRNLESNPVRAFFYQAVERLIAGLPFSCFLTLSRYTRNTLRLLGVADNRLEVAYGGVDRLVEESISKEGHRKVDFGFPENSFVFLTSGRTGISKGIELMAQAAGLILKARPEARFVFIVTPGHPGKWQQTVASLNKLPPDTFRLIPGLPREKLLLYLAAADCVIIPSLSEGFGFAALEACFFGKRVVATDAGSLPEVVFGRYRLVKPGSVKALMEGCLQALRDELEESPVKNFSWSKTAGKVENICLGLLRKWR